MKPSKRDRKGKTNFIDVLLRRMTDEEWDLLLSPEQVCWKRALLSGFGLAVFGAGPGIMGAVRRGIEDGSGIAAIIIYFLLILASCIAVTSATPISVYFLRGLKRTLVHEAMSALSRKKSVARPPGLSLRRLTWLFSKKTRTHILEPILRDMQDEVFEALARGERLAAGAARARGTFNFFQTIALQLPVSLCRILTVLWKALA